jgi:microtubule-associated protein-like 6
MGCGSSSEAYSPGDNGGWDDDLDFDESVKRRDKRNLKVCSGAPDGGKDDDDRGEDYTEYSEPRFGYSGQIMEPDNHNDVNLEKPTATFELEHVYGYRCMDTRQNVWFNKNGKIVYFTAALGVIMDPSDNSQMYFGGGEVDCTAKNVARDNNHHTDDIMSIALNEARDTAVSGQVGSSPAIFCWDACTGEKKCRIKIAKGARGIAAVAFSQDGEYIAAVDLHNEHRVYCFTSNGQQLMKQNGDTNKIKDVAFSKTPGDTRFATAGKKHIYFWDAKDASFKKKGIFDGNPMTSFSAVMWDADGNCYTGGANGGIYKWAAETRMCTGFSQSHKKGCFVSALNIFEGKIYSGAKDNQIAITNCESMECT